MPHTPGLHMGLVLASSDADLSPLRGCVEDENFANKGSLVALVS